MSKRTYRWNPETQQIEEITGRRDEWINTGVRYGSETLQHMRDNGLVPPTDFTNHWDKADAERARKAKLASGDTSAVRPNAERKQQIAEAVRAIRSGYRPGSSRGGSRIPGLD